MSRILRRPTATEPQSPLRFGLASAGVLAAVALLLGAVSLLASYLPARRATCLDPMVALRAE